ncbi:response regulator transcription factor [Marinospirillum alkaliphilum]|uniref:Two component transcriptional regulator, LuxR family n=1 Tax=Marinospirillum alkaliphilum DSM 21637 TaxID=1122209 RepID=A0A1K1TVT8_9GAMM|nr:response regulator transcription factor [Marinospirillum alkaliphilum]SFX04648.1 two component transcriptional regulator, LuxR family [Marinospirillum alkaliphilum DSM 21637]
MNRAKITVVLVEDDPAVRQRFKASINRHPELEWVGEAANVRDGKALVLEACPRVLLVDLGLPDGSGLEVISEVARKLPETEIMVVSMFGDEGHVIQAIEAGASGYILKDTDDASLAEHIIQLCDGGSPMSPMIARHLLKRMHQGSQSSSYTTTSGEQLDGIALTPREMQLLKLLARGYTYREVAEDLAVSSHTVNSHIKNLYRKLSVNTKNEAVYEATRQGLLDIRTLG